MGEFWDAERGAKAATWCAFYIVLWLLMQLSCEVGLPSNCTAASEPMEVLTELPFLVAFAVGQASAVAAVERTWVSVSTAVSAPGGHVCICRLVCIPTQHADLRVAQITR